MKITNMYRILDHVDEKPAIFSAYTAESLWADEYRSKRMLDFHLNGCIDVSSRNTKFIDESCSWIIEFFQLGPNKTICDFGCGPGLYTSRLARSGAQVTGLDFSENSIQYAQQQAIDNHQTIKYINRNYLNFVAKEKFDLITMIMCDFCVLSPAQRKLLVSVFSNHLQIGGAILIDVYSMMAFHEYEEARYCEKNQLDHFWHEENYYCFVNKFKYESEKVSLDKYSIFPEYGEPEIVYNWLQYFSPETLMEELSASGLNTPIILKDVSGRPFSEQHTEFAIVATT